MAEQRPKSTKRIMVMVVSVAIIVGIVVGFHYGQRIINGLGLGNTTRQKVAGSEKWAEPIEMPGVDNLHKVSDGLYRGAQPTSEGMVNLEKAGIKTIVNLRSLHSDRDELGQTHLRYEHIPMNTWHPEQEDVIRFLDVVTDPNAGPVFVHCQRGADRTGTMCAVYRVVVQGWTKQQALDEMTKGGFGFYAGWDELVDCIDKLDIDRLKAHIGQGQ